MADRAQPLRPWGPLAGAAVTAVLVAVIFGSLGAVAWRADALSRPAPADWAALRFTLTQAALSAIFSVALAVPVARALARRSFFGRPLLITLLGAPFILPTIVAVFGLLAVFGRSGVLSTALGWIGLPPVQIYGLHGVVLAHVFFNMPLATRLILQGWLAIPAERFRLAAALGFGPGDIARRLEWPMLREVVPGAILVIFLICLTSFAVALTLGGGPRATTVELAIYQAFRFDFDLGRAAMLAVVQFALCAVAALTVYRLAIPAAMGGGLDRRVERWDARSPLLRAQDALILTAAALFLLAPLVMIVLDGLAGVPGLSADVWVAAGRSAVVALAATALTIILALALALSVVRMERGQRRRGAAWLETLGMTSLAASPLVIGTGLFILVFPFADPARLALPVTALVNAVMALPFALRALLPAARDVEAGFGPLADSLGMRGMARLRLLVLPRLRHPLSFSAGLAAALSAGDLGVIVLFAGGESATLPLQLYRLMAAYRMDDAAAAALLLLAMSLVLFWAFDRGGRARA